MVTKTAKRTPRKAVPKKAPTPKVTPKPAAKKAAVVKKAPPVKKAAVKKTAPAKAVVAKVANPREFDEHGFVVGTDSSLIAAKLLEGGNERGDVNEAIRTAIGKTSGIATRGGGEKNVPALTAGILNRLKEQGYTVEASWKVLPPTAASKRAATRAANKKAVATPAPVVKATPARRAPAKKAAVKAPAKRGKK